MMLVALDHELGFESLMALFITISLFVPVLLGLYLPQYSVRTLQPDLTTGQPGSLTII